MAFTEQELDIITRLNKKYRLAFSYNDYQTLPPYLHISRSYSDVSIFMTFGSDSIRDGFILIIYHPFINEQITLEDYIRWSELQAFL
jgi:hypothetical protein